MGIEFRYPPQQVGPMKMWFKPENFRKVIDVCTEKGLGISTIEVYKGGYADTLMSDDFGGNPFDPNWYTNEFEDLVKKYCLENDEEVLFSGWYLEPEKNNKANNSSNVMSSEQLNKEIINKTSFWSRMKSWWP